MMIPSVVIIITSLSSLTAFDPYDITGLFGDLIAFHTFSATVLYGEFAHGGTFTHTFFRYNQKVIPLGAQLHADYLIPGIAEVDADRTPMDARPVASYVRLLEADTLAVFGYQDEYPSCCLVEFYLDELIVHLSE